jgi:hypothetical protein
MLYIGLFAMFVIVIGAIALYLNKDTLFGKKKKKEEDDKKDDGLVFSVTEEGSKMEKYRSRTENYISFPRVEDSVSPYMVYAYNPNDTQVDPINLMGSVQTWNSETSKCPDGTLDCLYYERVTDGRITSITDKNGKDLIKSFTDDLWAGKLTVYDENIDIFDEIYQMDEGGQMSMMKGDTKMILKPGINVPPGMFFMVLLLKLKKKYPDNKPVINIDLPVKTRAEIEEALRAMN